jgi:hypothetical protein
LLLTAWLSENDPKADEAPSQVGESRDEELLDVAREHDERLPTRHGSTGSMRRRSRTCDVRCAARPDQGVPG